VQPDTTYSVSPRILPPEDDGLPAAFYSNHILANRMNQEVTLTFTQVRMPLTLSGPTESEVERLQTEGLRAKHVVSVTIPETVLEPLITMLEKMRMTADGKEG